MRCLAYDLLFPPHNHKNFSEEELKGILAHEIAHIYYGHTKAILLNTLGNGIFSLFIVVFRFILRFIENFQQPIQQKTNGIIYFFLNLIRNLFELFIFCFLFIGNVLLSGNNRACEYKADEFAFRMGYGDDLTQALYLLKRMSMGEDSSLVARMQASHPRTSTRIMRLETMIDGEEP